MYNTIRSVVAILWIVTKGYHAVSLECRQRQEKWSLENSTGCHRLCEFPTRPRLCEYEFRVTWTYSMAAPCTDCLDNAEDCKAPGCVTVDGSTRPVITINEISPGPSIQVCHRDIIRVKVINDLLQDGSGVTIHWHGIHQAQTVWADGVPMITQCPIPAGTSFVYKFVADPPGTHWWHSHVGVQRGDGLYGAFIIRIPKEREINSNEYDFDLPNHYMLLNDWISTSSLDTYMRASETGETNPSTYTILTNGKGWNKELNETIPNSVYEVEQGYRYRMRVVNTALNTCNFRLSIESHHITVIGTDGFEMHPITVDSIIIAAGERLDFVLEASAPASIYCIYITPTWYNMCPASGTAILRYKQASGPANCQSPPYTNGSVFSTVVGVNLTDTITEYTFEDTYAYESVDPYLNTVDVRHYVALDVGKTSFYSKNTEITTDNNDYYNCRGLMNHVEFEFPEKPLILSGASKDTCQPTANKTIQDECSRRDTCKCTQLFEMGLEEPRVKSEFSVQQTEQSDDCSTINRCRCTNTLKVKLGQVVELVIFDSFGFIDHPMHLHGHSFRVLGQGILEPSITSEEELIEYDNKVGLPRIALNSTVIKDTVSVPDNGYVIIRWKADNPGYWLFHCHAEYHTLMGMAMVVQVGEDDEMPDLPKDFPTCGPWSPD